MSRAALVDDVGRVVNVILVGDDYEPPPGLTAHDLDDVSRVGPDWRLDDGKFVAPDPVPVVVPADPVAELTARVAQQDALLQLLLLGGVKDEDGSLDDPTLIDLPDAGGSLDDPGLDLPDLGETLDDLDTAGGL